MTDVKEAAKIGLRDVIMVSPRFALIYHGEHAAAKVEASLHKIDMNWRKRKKLINAARRNGRREWIAKVAAAK